VNLYKRGWDVYIAKDVASLAQALYSLFEHGHFFICGGAEDVPENLLRALFFVHPEVWRGNWNICGTSVNLQI
jgi:hypothetical protein